MYIILHLGIAHSAVQSSVYLTVCPWPRVKTIGGPDDIWLLGSTRILAGVFISALFIKTDDAKYNMLSVAQHTSGKKLAEMPSVL